MPSLYSLVLSLAKLSGVIASPDAWSRLWSTCPTDCGNTSSPSDWAVYHSIDQLPLCNRTTRLQFSLFSDSSSRPGIRACTASSEFESARASYLHASKNIVEKEVTFQLGWWDTPTSSPPAAVKPAVEDVRKALSNSANNGSSVLFSRSDIALVGLYAGSGILHSDVATTALKEFADYIETQDSVGRVILQYCGKTFKTGLGIVVDASGDLAAVKQIMRGWTEVKCQTQFDGSKSLSTSKLRFKTHSNSTSSAFSERQGDSHLRQRRPHCEPPAVLFRCPRETHANHWHQVVKFLLRISPNPTPIKTFASR